MRCGGVTRGQVLAFLFLFVLGLLPETNHQRGERGLGGQGIPWVAGVDLHLRRVVVEDGVLAGMQLPGDWVCDGARAVSVDEEDVDWARASWGV